MSSGMSSGVSSGMSSVHTTTENCTDAEDYTFNTAHHTIILENSLMKELWEAQVAAWIYKLYTPVITGLGIAGNIACSVVLLCGKLQKSSTFTYMTALAACDAASEILVVVDYVGNSLNYTLYTNTTCSMLYFVFFFFIHASVMLTVAMTAERFLIIKYPLKANSSYTISRARVAVTLVAFASFLVNVHNFFTREVIQDENMKKSVCVAVGKTKEMFLYEVWPWIDGSLYCYFPFGALLVMNILIVTHLRKSDRFFFHDNVHNNEKSSDRRSRESRQITVMLLLVTLTFLVLVGPMGVLLIVEQRILSTGSPLERAKLRLTRIILNSLTYTNHAINFLLYFLSGGQFRKEVLRLFCSSIHDKEISQNA